MTEEIVRETGLVLETDDGINLVADAWRPVSGGPFPVLLQRLPYGRSVASAPVLPHPAWFARRGYAVVVQDVRGRGDSGGTFAPFVHEGADGCASIEWAARLPFSSGSVGTYGFSYQGINQLLAAARRPPSLRAIAPMMCGLDPFDGWMYHGGCRNWPNLARWAAQLAAQEPGAVPRVPDLGALPIDTALGDVPPTWFSEWLDHHVDGPYWEARRANATSIDVPVFTVLGWFDYLSAATSRLATQTDAEVVAGPWSHMPWGTRAGDVELGPQANPSFAHDALLAFFDRHLKGHEPAVADRVRYLPVFGSWSSAPSWPPPSTSMELALASDGDANSRHGGGRLVDAPIPGGPGDVLVAEPLAPYPGALDPLEDESSAEDRRDVLCFTSDPLNTTLEITGEPVVRVSVRCDRPTHDIVVSLVLVDADAGGAARRLTTGARRVEGVEADAEHDVEVVMRPLSVVARAGQRLRLDVSGGRFPAHDRNPHVVGTAPTRDEHRVATIWLSSGQLLLPIVTSVPRQVIDPRA